MTITITCTGNQHLGGQMHALRFTKPPDFSFTPGQYLRLAVPAVHDGSDTEARTFSIASSPDEDGLLFLVKNASTGRTGQWIEHVLRVGTSVAMQGPFGTFFVDESTPKAYLFIATGSGVAPFRSHIRSLLFKRRPNTINLLVGVRHEDDALFLREFEDWQRQHAHFSLHYTLSRPAAGWHGHAGRVQMILPTVAPGLRHKSVYLSGHPSMVADVSEFCRRQGTPQADIHVEHEDAHESDVSLSVPPACRL